MWKVPFSSHVKHWDWPSWETLDLTMSLPCSESFLLSLHTSYSPGPVQKTGKVWSRVCYSGWNSLAPVDIWNSTQESKFFLYPRALCSTLRLILFFSGALTLLLVCLYSSPHVCQTLSWMLLLHGLSHPINHIPTWHEKVKQIAQGHTQLASVRARTLQSQAVWCQGPSP